MGGPAFGVEAGAGPPVDGPKPHDAHQPLHPLPAFPYPLPFQSGHHPPRPRPRSAAPTAPGAVHGVALNEHRLGDVVAPGEVPGELVLQVTVAVPISEVVVRVADGHAWLQWLFHCQCQPGTTLAYHFFSSPAAFQYARCQYGGHPPKVLTLLGHPNRAAKARFSYFPVSRHGGFG